MSVSMYIRSTCMLCTCVQCMDVVHNNIIIICVRSCLHERKLMKGKPDMHLTSRLHRYRTQGDSSCHSNNHIQDNALHNNIIMYLCMQ